MENQGKIDLNSNGLPEFKFGSITGDDDFKNIKDTMHEIQLVDDKMQTKVEGIYAAGDIIKKQVYQLVSAASEGAVAAINIINSLSICHII